MRGKKLKGVSQIIAAILIIAIIAALSGAAYQWGRPIIQKNVDTTTLIKAENFLFKLDEKINEVAKGGGTEELIFNLPGKISIFPKEDRIDFSIETKGSIYALGGFVCFNRNCDLSGGTWGKDSYSVLGVKVSQSGGYNALTTYSIIYRNLTSGSKTYLLDIITPGNATIDGYENSKILIKKVGEERGIITKTIVELDIR